MKPWMNATNFYFILVASTIMGCFIRIDSWANDSNYLHRRNQQLQNQEQIEESELYKKYLKNKKLQVRL